MSAFAAPVQPPPAMKAGAGVGADSGEFRAGWPTVALAVVGVGTSVSALLIYSLGTMVVPLQQAFGWSRGDLQLAVSFLAAGGAISVNFVGWLNLRHGMRAVTGLSMLALAVGFLALTAMPGSIGWLYLGYFLLPFIGIGTTPVTWTHVVNLHFEKHRGLALSLVLCGTGLAAAGLPLLLSTTTSRWGWQAGYAALAGLVLLFWLSMAWRRLPHASGVQVAAAGHAAGSAPAVVIDGMRWQEAVKTRNFWVCNIGLALVVSAIYGLTANTVPLLRDLGLSSAQASGVFGAFGVSLIVGRLVVGVLIDRLWAPGVAAVALALPALGCLILFTAHTQTPLALLVLATALCGMGAGAEMDIAAYLVARYFGLRDYGRLFGMHLGLVTLGSAVAPFAFAALLDASGANGNPYGPLLTLCGAAFLVGPALLLTLGRYPPRQPPLTLKESS